MAASGRARWQVGRDLERSVLPPRAGAVGRDDDEVVGRDLGGVGLVRDGDGTAGDVGRRRSVERGASVKSWEGGTEGESAREPDREWWSSRGRTRRDRDARPGPAQTISEVPLFQLVPPWKRTRACERLQGAWESSASGRKRSGAAHLVAAQLGHDGASGGELHELSISRWLREARRRRARGSCEPRAEAGARGRGRQRRRRRTWSMLPWNHQPWLPVAGYVGRIERGLREKEGRGWVSARGPMRPTAPGEAGRVSSLDGVVLMDRMGSRRSRKSQPELDVERMREERAGDSRCSRRCWPGRCLRRRSRT